MISHSLIENDVVIGDRTTIKSGVYVWDGLRIGSDVFIGPNATFTNDKFPRSKVYPESFSQTSHPERLDWRRHRCSAWHHHRYRRHGWRRCGRDQIRACTPSLPARRASPATWKIPPPAMPAKPHKSRKSRKTQLSALGGDVTTHRFKYIADARGDLSVGEFHKEIPFTPKRYFLVFNV